MNTLTQGQQRRAALAVADHAQNADDCRQLLVMLGLAGAASTYRKPIDHGTYRGAKQHYYRREPMCERCRKAERAYQSERRRAKHAGAVR